MKSRRMWTDEEDKRIKSLYLSGKNCTEIGLLVGRAKSSVDLRIKKLGVKKRCKSEAKLLCSKRGKEHHSFKNGRRTDGYLVRASQGKNILIHREVAENCLGRKLDRKEVVHHVNDNRSDNRPENLWVFACQADHARFHKTGKEPESLIKITGGQDDKTVRSNHRK